MFQFANRLRGLIAMDCRGPDKFMLWVDAVGGFWVCLADQVLLGQPGPRGVDVPILGDLAGRHARIRRDGESYLIEPLRDARLDGRPIREAGLLRDGSRIEMGSVQLAFRQPHPLSATARLDFVSHHRTHPAADAVLLMADSCVLGPRAQSHVVCREWSGEVVLFRQEAELCCRAPGAFEVDGRRQKDRARLSGTSRVAAEWFSFSLEPMVQ